MVRDYPDLVPDLISGLGVVDRQEKDLVQVQNVALEMALQFVVWDLLSSVQV